MTAVCQRGGIHILTTSDVVHSPPATEGTGDRERESEYRAFAFRPLHRSPAAGNRIVSQVRGPTPTLPRSYSLIRHSKIQEFLN